MYLFLSNYSKKNYKFIIKFIIVGVLTFTLNLIFLWFFYSYLKANYVVAISFAYVLTVAIHFVLNRNFTFQKKQSSIAVQGLRYAFLLGGNYLSTIAIGWLVVGLFQLTPYVSVLLSTAIISISNFLLMKNFVFLQFRVRQ
jgi:putative flippase GtrA